MARPRISLAVDILLLGHMKGEAHILLVERKNPPFQGCWALPGGFVEEEENLIQAAVRELAEETGVSETRLHPVPGHFDAPGRDPRGRVVSAVFWGIAARPSQAKAGSDARKVRWFSVNRLPSMAFDHDRIIAAAQEHIGSLYGFAKPLLAGAGPMKPARLMELVESFCGTCETFADKETAKP